MKVLISVMSFIKRLVANGLDFTPESAAATTSTQALESTRRAIREIDWKISKRYVTGREKEAALQERERLRRRAERKFNVELALIENKLRGIRSIFARQYEAWTGEPFMPDQQPAPMDEEVLMARGYRLAAVVTAVLDVMLVTFLMQEYYGLLVAFPVALVTTFCLTVLADNAIAVATRGDAPHYSLHLITRYVFWPTIIITMPPVMLMLSARYVSGLPDVLSGLFDLLASLATWIVTPGLLLLGGAMLAIAHLYAWSLPLSRSFEQLVRLHEDVVNERDDFLNELRPPRGGNGPRLPLYALIFVLGLSAALTGCWATPSRTLEKNKVRAETLTPPAGKAVLHFEIDRSGSVERKAGAAAAANLHGQLPQMIEAMQAAAIEVRHFAADGWSAPVTYSIALPRLLVPPMPVINGGKLSSLEPRKQDLERRIREEWDRSKQQAAEQYQRDFAAALAKVNADMLNPGVAASASCTDAHGVLSRISAGRSSGRAVYVIVTDGYDTCTSGPLAPLAPPQGQVKVLILQVAAQAKEGEGKRPAQQFANRREVLQKAAPWAEIIPPFVSNLSDYIRAQTEPLKTLAPDTSREPQR